MANSKNFVLFCALSAYFVCETLSSKVPSNFKVCHKSDPKFTECMSRNIKHALDIVVHDGLADPKLPPLEPIVIDKIEFGNTGGAVNIQQKFRKFKIYGITNSQFKDVKIDLKKCDFRYVTFTPTTFSTAEYSMKGTMLFVPITGDGIGNITSTNVKTVHDVKCKFYKKKNGKTYLRVKDYKVNWDAEKVRYSFSNLFNGNKLLSDEIHRLMNENSKIITSELEPAVEQAYGDFFKAYSNRFYSKIPFDELYPD